MAYFTFYFEHHYDAVSFQTVHMLTVALDNVAYLRYSTTFMTIHINLNK